MTRLNARTHLAVRLAATIAGAAAIMLVSACGAGQIAETAKIKAAVPGGNTSISVPDGARPGTLWIKNVTFDYNDPDGYPAGGSAPISVRIINDSGSDLVLAGVTATLAGGGDLGAVALHSASAAPAPSASAPVPASPSGSASPAAPPATPSAAPTPTPSASALNIKIPADQLVDLSTSANQYLQVTGLTQALAPGMRVNLTFTFADSSNSAISIPSVPVPAQIAPPMVPAGRSTVDISPSGE